MTQTESYLGLFSLGKETTKRIPLSALLEYRQERYRTAEIKIICGDCIKGMQELAEGSVDAVIADPPYGIDYANTKGTRIKNDKRPYIWFLQEAL